MHEVFLCRVAAHPVLRKDLNFHVFLEYNQDVSNPSAEQKHGGLREKLLPGLQPIINGKTPNTRGPVLVHVDRFMEPELLF